MELYIIRHAQSENNALMEDQTNRVKDPNLTEVGYQQADCVAQHLTSHTNLEQLVRIRTDASERKQHYSYGITHLYCSAMRRAMQTAKPIGERLGLIPEVWVDIHEHGGIWLEKEGITTGYTGMTRSAIEQEFKGYILPETITETGWWKPEAGKEDIQGCHARAMRVAMQLKERAQAEDSKDDKVAIVVHGTFIDCLLKALVGRSPSEEYFHWHYNTAITRVDFWSGRMVIRYVNRISHLPPEMVT